IEAPGARAGFLAALRKHHAPGKTLIEEPAAGEITR
ncbi:MAG: DNA repair protein RecO, partial [Mesorhizobium sp.]